MPVSDLQSSLDDAVLAEEYEKAAMLRDAINAKKEEDTLLVLERELRAAIEVEDYEDAARCRDAIAEEIASRPPPAPTGSSSGTRSSATTEGVRVDVQSIFLPQHSGVQGNMFAYQITITNVAHPTTIKLISRHWEIKDAKGRERIVDGEGVIGEQPELAPGESFTYQSSCPLQTATGSMKGHFEFYSRASTSTSWSTSFLVYIAQFGLDVAAPRSFD
jgi:ApaG protein